MRHANDPHGSCEIMCSFYSRCPSEDIEISYNLQLWGSTKARPEITLAGSSRKTVGQQGGQYTHTKSPNSASPTQHYTDAVKPDDLCAGLLEGGLCHDRPSQPCLPLVETVAASVHLEDNIGRVQLLSAHPPSPPYARIVLPSWTKSWM